MYMRCLKHVYEEWRGGGLRDFIPCIEFSETCISNTSMESGGVGVYETPHGLGTTSCIVCFMTTYLSGLNPLSIVSIAAFHIISFLLYSLYLYKFVVFVICVVLIA